MHERRGEERREAKFKQEDWTGWMRGGKMEVEVVEAVREVCWCWVWLMACLTVFLLLSSLLLLV